MSCTHDCGCTPETRDARTDEWVRIAPVASRPAPLSDEHGAEAPGQGEDSPGTSEPVLIDPSTLAPGTVVEIELPSGNRALRYVDEGGCQFIAGHVGNGTPYPWGDARIVRVFTEDKSASPQGPALPRQIEPEDVRVGMVVERRKGDSYFRRRVTRIDGSRIMTDEGVVTWRSFYADQGWSLWLIEDAPVPEDPDAKAIEAIITAYRRSPECSTDSAFGEAVLDYLRAQGFDVTARAEQCATSTGQGASS